MGSGQGLTPRRIEIVAEIANAHQGDPVQALNLARIAAHTGADAIKFQIYTADELLVRTHPRYEHFSQQAFAPETWQKLLQEALTLGIKVYCDVFGHSSLELAHDAGIHGVKIHSSDLGNDPLVADAAVTFSSLMLGVGGATAREIDHVISIARQHRPDILPILLHGFQSYPTAVGDASLCRIPWLLETFGSICRVGYMDHCDGESFFAYALPLMAIAQGCCLVEKHITLDRSKRGVDYYSSLNPDEFTHFVEMVRLAQDSLGHNPLALSAAEISYRQGARKHWVAARNLQKGEELSTEMVAAKRVADVHTHCVALNQLLGKRLSTQLAADDLISRASVENTVWALVVARSASKRLPRKALLPVAGMPTIEHLLRRLQQATRLHRIILCTTTEKEDDSIAEIGDQLGITVYRGANDNVLERMCGALAGSDVDLALRVTGDDILIDPVLVDTAIDQHLRANAEYSALKDLPSGFDFEIFDAALLREIYDRAVDSSGTEYLTYYIDDYYHHFAQTRIQIPETQQRLWRLTLDTPNDYRAIDTVLSAMKAAGKALTYTLADVLEYLRLNPTITTEKPFSRAPAIPQNEINTKLRWLSNPPE